MMRGVTQLDTYRALLPNQLVDRIIVPDLSIQTTSILRAMR